MTIDFSNIDAIVGGFTKVLSLSSVGGPPPVPTPLILIGVPQRTGLSPTKIASRIIARKSEAGLPVGVLPSGNVNPDEIMERIRIEEIINAFQQEAIITVAIPPGITLTAAGISPTGPVSVFGSTIIYSKGYGVIQ
jgi:subtilisin family serine protease